MTSKGTTRKERERGNALFLILVAVALFAALSYAVTQSGRGNGSGITKETDSVAAGEMIEIPAAVQAAITRMVVGGTAVYDITFTGAASPNDVFDLSNGGGGATNQKPPPSACNVVADCAAWTYVQATSSNSGNFIYGIGTAITVPTGGAAIAVLQGTNGLSLGVCTQVQKGLGFSTSVPPVGAGGPVLWGTPAAFNAAGSASTVKSTDTSLDGKAFACFQNTTSGLYAYYHALIEQ